MECGNPSLRVNGELVPRLVGKRVRIAGKIEVTDNGSPVLITSDNIRILLQGPPLESGERVIPCAEVTGTVINESTIQQESYRKFQDSWDTANYNELVKLSNGPYSALFV